jgi:thiol-disulfide isomerase/thioredoxin
MVRRTTLAVLTAFFGSTVVAARPATASSLVATVGQPAPAFVLEDLSGALVSAKALLGKPVYINVFATWCPPCRTELPAIVRSYGRYKDKVTFLGVDEQEPAGKIEPFTRALNIRYRIAVDHGQMEASYRAYSIPISVFIDRHGIVRALFRGPVPESLLERDLARIAGP